MLYFFDNKEKLIGFIDNQSSISITQTEPLRGVITLEASFIDGFNTILEQAMYVGHVDAVNDDEFQLYKIQTLTLGKENEGSSLSATHVVFDELKARDIHRKVDFQKLNISAVFMEILKNSRWKLGECNSSKILTLSAENTTSADLISKIIENYSVELRYRLKFVNNKIVGRFIDVFDIRGRDTYKRYAYGHNALKVVKEINSNSLYTAIIPRGKEVEIDEHTKEKVDISKVTWSKASGNYVDKPYGSDTLELKELSKKYGFSDDSPRTFFKNYDTEDANELIKMAYDDLVTISRPKVEFSATIEDLGELNIGDSIVIVRKDLDIYYKTRVFQIKRDLLQSNLSEITLGDNLDLKNPNSSLNKRIKQIGERLESIVSDTGEIKDKLETIPDSSMLDDLREQLKQGMYDHDSYNYFLKKGNEFGLPPGFYAFNKPIEESPTSGIWMNGGKMAIANTRNPDGTLNWSTWLNGDGIIADYIAAGILQGGNVRWNLEDGTFLIGNSINDYSFYWDGSTLHMKDVDIDLRNNSTVKGISESVGKNNKDIKKANDAITQTQTSVRILKDSISSKVSKAEILSDKEIQNALKGRDGTNGANGSNFTWNLIKKSRSDVRISTWSNSKLEILDEKYQLPEMNVNDAKKIKFSGGDIQLKGFLSYRANMDSDMIKGNKYTVSIYVENLSENDLQIRFNGFNWQSHKLKPQEKRYVVCKGEYDGNANQVQFLNSSDKDLVFAYGLLKAEDGYNDNPVWSPHISEINGKDGTFTGEIGGRNLIRNSDKITGWTKYDGGNHLITDEYMQEFNIQGYRVKSDAANATDFIKTYVNFDVDDLIVGKTYTFSVYVKNNRDVPAQLRVNGFNWNFAYELNANECKRFIITGKRDSMDGYWKNRIQFQLRSANKSQFVDMTVSRPQLEEGDVATSWKPNHFDLISETQTVKRTFEAYKEQTDRRLLSTVSQTDFNKNNVAIQKQFSSVDQKANGIISTVSSNYTNLSKKIDGKPSAATIQSLISQKVDNVKIEVSNQISGVNSSIDIMQGDIKLKADKTDLWGLVSFNDLKDSNSYTVINGGNIKTGKISSADGSSWINLKDGNFSFYHNSLFIDENVYDWNSKTKRTRLHTLGTFRVSYGKNPSVELNSGGITLFKDKEDQDSKGTNKIQSNGDGNVQIGSIDDNGNTTIYAEIGKKEGYVMHIYGSLFVHRNLRVKDAIRYGASCQQGTTF